MKKLFSFISVFALAAILGVSSVSAQKTTLAIEKLWSITEPGGGVARQGFGMDGALYYHQYGKGVYKVASATATRELIIDATVTGIGAHAVAKDDAGNIVIFGSASFPSAATSELFIYVQKKGEATGAQVACPALEGFNRTDFIAAAGDVFSAEGGHLYLINNDGKAAFDITIVNGATATATPIAGMTSGASQNTIMDVHDGIYHYASAGSGVYSFDGTTATKVDGLTDIQAQCLGTTHFTLAGKEMWVYHVGGNYTSEFKVLNKTDNNFVSDKDGNVLFVLHDASKVSGGALRGVWFNTEKIDDNNYLLYAWHSHDGGAVYKVSAVVAATITLNVNDAAMGTVEGAGDVAVGGNATVKAIPNVGHSFVCWMNGTDTVSTKAEYTFKVEKDVTLTAHFQKEDDVKLTLAVNDATKGSITLPEGIVMGENTVAYGTKVALTAVPVEGATFMGWYAGEALYNTAYTIEVAVTADLALTANFVTILALQYELNGGVTNDSAWTSKGALMLEIQNDYNATYNASLAVVKEENGIYYFNINGVWMTETEAQGQPYGVAEFFQNKTWSDNQKCAKLFLETKKEKYAFLVEIIDHFKTTAAAGRGLDSLKNMALTAADAYFRADVSGFMLNSPAGDGYPYTCNWAQAGKPEAYVPVWKHAFANPTEIVTEVVLNAPYKEGLTFGGWYATADFSGEPITKVSPESVIPGGKLYAKWVQYIPTIAEVRALENNTKTLAAGYVNHVGGNTIYIEDASGYGMDIYMKNSGIKAGQQVVVSGTYTTSKGWPRLDGDSVVSATNGEALPVTSVPNLTTLVNDSVYAYYGRRVAINGLKVAKYDDKGDAYFTDGIDTVQGYYMKLDQATFAVGTKVVINGAVAAWYGSKFQFTGDIASVTVAAAAGKDNYVYPARGENGEYTLTNEWIISQQEGTYSDNAPGATLTVRGMAAKDGIMYFIRSLDNVNNQTLPLGGQLVPVNATNGLMLDPITIKGEHLFEVQKEDSTWAKGVTVAFNDIKADQAGNLLVGAITGNTNTFFIYKVDPKTGEATEVIKQKIQDIIKASDGTPITYRFDAFGVYGDVDGNACIMAIDANSMYTYRWIITDGVAGDVEQIAVNLDPEYDESLNIDATSFSTAPQIFPQDEKGSLFYVDGKDMLPMLIDEDGILAQDFISVQKNVGLQVWNNPGDTATVGGGLNGLCEFKVGDDYFFLFGATNFNENPPSVFALYKFADKTREFGGMEPFWYFPEKGLGVDISVKNGCFCAVPSVEVEGNVAKIYLYSVDLGYGVYTLTCPEGTGVYDVEAETINAHKLLENGQVFIIKNGVKYNILGVTVK